MMPALMTDAETVEPARRLFSRNTPGAQAETIQTIGTITFSRRVGIHFNRRSESILSRLFKKKEPLDARFKVNFLVSEFFFSVERWDKSRG